MRARDQRRAQAKSRYTPDQMNDIRQQVEQKLKEKGADGEPEVPKPKRERKVCVLFSLFVCDSSSNSSHELQRLRLSCRQHFPLHSTTLFE